MQVRLDTNLKAVSRFQRTFYRDQVPQASKLALNELAKKFQKQQVHAMKLEFTVRNKTFTERAVKIKPFARKEPSPFAQVQIEPPGGKRTADIYGKFEEGGTKRPRGRHLAIPDGVKRSSRGIVTKANRPRAIVDRRKKVFILPGLGIFERSGRRRHTRLKRLFSFAKSARIEPSLGFYDRAEQVARRYWPSYFARNFRKAVSTAK